MYLETPLQARFVGEGKKLVVTAPVPYLVLVRTVVATGVFCILVGFFPIEVPNGHFWWLMVGAMLIFAGVLAAYSLDAVVFDLRERVYRRRQGPGLISPTVRGRLEALDAVVVVSHSGVSLQTGRPYVQYFTVLHWKAEAEPILILETSPQIPFDQSLPIYHYAGQALNTAQRFAQSLGVRFFDNTRFSSPPPIPFWR